MVCLKVIYLSVQSSDSSNMRAAADAFIESTGVEVDLFHANSEAVDGGEQSPCYDGDHQQALLSTDIGPAVSVRL